MNIISPRNRKRFGCKRGLREGRIEGSARVCAPQRSVGGGISATRKTAQCYFAIAPPNRTSVPQLAGRDGLSASSSAPTPARLRGGCPASPAPAAALAVASAVVVDGQWQTGKHSVLYPQAQDIYRQRWRRDLPGGDEEPDADVERRRLSVDVDLVCR